MKLRSILFTVIFILSSAAAAFALPALEVAEGKYLKIFYDGQFGFTYRSIGSGASGEGATTSLNFRRNRLGFIGTYNEQLSFYFQMEYIDNKVVYPLYVSDFASGDKLYILDAQIRYNPMNELNFLLGKFKHNFTRENLESCFEPLSFDRSLFVYTPFATSRDLGVAVWGNLFNDYLQYRVDVMQGNAGSSGDPAPSSNFRYTGRLNINLLEPETSYGVAGTYVGEQKVLTIGGAFQYEPQAVYSNILLKTGAKDYMAFTFDIFFEYPTVAGTFTLGGAYVNISMNDAYEGLAPAPSSYGLNGQKNGFYGKAAYLLPMKIGPGQLQVFARYDSFKFANLNNGLTNFYNQQINWVGAGVNYYIKGQDVKVVAQYSFTDFKKEDPTNANFRDFSTIELYLQVRL